MNTHETGTGKPLQPLSKVAVSTYGLNIESGYQSINLRFDCAIRLADATHLADVVMRWCEQYNIGGNDA